MLLLFNTLHFFEKISKNICILKKYLIYLHRKTERNENKTRSLKFLKSEFKNNRFKRFYKCFNAIY